MEIAFELPEDVARQFASDAPGVSRAAVEALALEGLRSARLTTSQARRLLGIRSRYEMDGFLKSRGVFLESTVADVVRDSETALSSAAE